MQTRRSLAPLLLVPLVLVVPLVLLPAVAGAANWPEHPQLRAVRAETAPRIDGDLSDPAWRDAPEFTGFTQHDPVDTEPATLPTGVKIVYDDQAIYFGLRMEDTAPPTGRLTRRDDFAESDFVSINLDPQLDRLSGNAFTVNPSNVQVDTVLYDDIREDPSWDGVWESATEVGPRGWSAELRIPFSQLRFPDRPVQVWGVNITRRTQRIAELVRIVNTPKGQSGFVSHFADIVGIEGIHRGRPLELLPYAVARADLRSGVDPDDPLVARRETGLEGGLDLKLGLTSTLTLTGTVNPDFGQVEVDPAVVNLSEFETFYPEKRPFFTEGASLFGFGGSPAPARFNFIDPPSVFYSRRIGRAPQLVPSADFVDAPSSTRILGAAKVTGRSGGGWSLGILDALTDEESARFARDGERGRVVVEPRTNYFVSRVARESTAGSRIGLVLTSVDRQLDGATDALRRQAVTAGIDGFTRFRERTWILEGYALGSRIAGSARSITLAQSAPARYYQRPDASHVAFDPTRTSLAGWGARAVLTKATGLWRPIVALQAYSPGFETNDAGYLQRTDLVSADAVLLRVDETVTERFRETTSWLATWQNSNFAGDVLERGIYAHAEARLTNYWEPYVEAYLVDEALSDRLTRGGPLARTPAGWHAGAGLQSDRRKAFYFDLDASAEESDDGSFSRALSIELHARPASNVELTLEPSYERGHERNQYLAAFDDPAATGTYGRRYLFAEIERRTFELAARVDWTLDPRLSFQLYLQPFVATGDYHDPHALVAAGGRDYVPWPDAGRDPDFDLRSLRGSAVVRWELRPGSALYVAWNENRAGTEARGDFALGRDLGAILDQPSHDVVIVKLSYWLPL